MVSPNRQVGSFRILQALGKQVYQAIDERSGQEVAVKLLPLDSTDPEQLKIEAEGAKLQKMLDHPHIPKIYDCEILDGHLCISMELLDGEDLSKKGRLPVETAVQIAIEIGETLKATHNFNQVVEGKFCRSIIHGDIKPQNIRITSRNEVKVLDFGIAKATSAHRADNLFATLAYSSPERINNGWQVDLQSDLWSLGVVLWEMLAGKCPFQGSDEELKHNIRTHTITNALPADCPPVLQMIVEKMLTAEVADRYPDIEAILADLRNYQQDRPTLAEKESLEDDQPTRRTDAPERETVRTGNLSSEPMPLLDPPPPPAAAPPRPQISAPFVKIARTVGFALLLIAAAYLSISEYNVYTQAQQLSDKIALYRIKRTADITEIGDKLAGDYQTYGELQQRSRIPAWSLRPVRQPLKEKLLAIVEWVADEFRTNDQPSSKEKEWKKAEACLEYALRMFPDDALIAAMIEYCEAQVARLRGEGQSRNRRDEFNTAEMRFKAALEKKADWADPHLGLAILYAYRKKDFDKARNAIENVRRLGVEGKRIQALEADIYKDRGRELKDSVQATTDEDKQIELLTEAQEHLERARNLYLAIGNFGDSRRNASEVERWLAQIHEHLDRIEADTETLADGGF